MFRILLGIKHVILKIILNPTDIPIKSIFAKNYRGYNRHDKNLLSLRCWCFWRLSRNRLTINATTYTVSERSRKYLSKNVWVIALIVNRFRDKGCSTVQYKIYGKNNLKVRWFFV